MFYNCPYCNTNMDVDQNQTSPESIELTKCCQRAILLLRRTVTNRVGVGIPPDSYLKRLGIKVDTSPFPGMPKLKDRRPDSNWTTVTTSGAAWHVRICPKNIDNEAVGRPLGIGLVNEYSSRYEAHKHADSIDEYMDAIFSKQSKLHASHAALEAQMKEIREAREANDMPRLDAALARSIWD